MAMKTTTNASPRKIYKCKCGSEAIEIAIDEFDTNDPGIELCIWRFGHTATKTIRERIRWAWEILTKGTLYKDEVILSQATALELSTDLDAMSQALYHIAHPDCGSAC
jgi:hypothetical protein